MRLRPAYELWMGTFTTRDGGGLRANAQRGTCAASDRPLGERQMRHGGLIPTRASSQRPSLWHRRGRPLRGQACGSHSPRTPCVRVEATPGGGAFYGKTYSFDALSLSARSSFDSFVRCFSRPRLRTHRGLLDIRGPQNFSSFGPGPSADQLWHICSARGAMTFLRAVRRAPYFLASLIRGAMTFSGDGAARTRAPYFSTFDPDLVPSPL